MAGTLKILAIAVIVLGVIGVALGGTFVGLGMSKADMIKDQMRDEHVTYSALFPEDKVTNDNLIDSSSEAKKVADLIKEHRHAIAQTYQDLGRYDPTNPDHLKYTQAMNLENYLYMGVLAFGVTDSVIGSGVFMIVMGLAVVAVGIALLLVARKVKWDTAGISVNA